MERLFIFAIGGTGARVLRSFTMLLASGQIKLNEYDVYPIILDYDAENGDTAIATDCIETYNTIHNLTWKDKTFSKERGFFKSSLCQLSAGDAFGGSAFRMVYAPKGNNSFRKYIGYETLGYDENNSARMQKKVDTTVTKLLLQSLYNTDPVSDDSEMNLKMDVGFKGNPNIGCVVFHDIEEECEEFRSFLENLSANDKVVVIGSLFGGTGSSGVPEVIRKIQDKQAGVGAILVMPYFAPESRSGGTIRHDIFNSKTKAAINYYEKSLMKFDQQGNMLPESQIHSAYFLGDPKPTILKYCDGGQEQRNAANIVEFLSALSIMHFLEGGRGCFKYGSAQYIMGEGKSVKQLFHDDLRDEGDFLKPIVRRLTSLTVALKYFMFRICEADSRLKNTTYYSRFNLEKPHPQMKQLFEDLKHFWNLYKSWLDEMSNKNLLEDQGNSHGLTLYGTDNNLEVLIVNPKEEISKKGGWGSSKKRNPNKSVDGPSIDALINEAIKDFRPNGFSGSFITNDEEFLFMHGLFAAATNEDVILKKIFE